MEVGGIDGVAGRDIAAVNVVRGDTVLSLSCLRPPVLILAPAAGLSKFSTPIGLETRCSGGVEEGGGVGRIDTLCADGTRWGTSREAVGRSSGWMRGKSREWKGGGAGARLSREDFDDGRVLVGSCDIDVSSWA